MLNDLRWEGDCSFCWYWWNWWPSLFKRSFHKRLSSLCEGKHPLVYYFAKILQYLECNSTPNYTKDIIHHSLLNTYRQVAKQYLMIILWCLYNSYIIFIVFNMWEDLYSLKDRLFCFIANSYSVANKCSPGLLMKLQRT
jgi:hypothetical protein